MRAKATENIIRWQEIGKGEKAEVKERDGGRGREGGGGVRARVREKEM